MRGAVLWGSNLTVNWQLDRCSGCSFWHLSIMYYDILDTACVVRGSLAKKTHIDETEEIHIPIFRPDLWVLVLVYSLNFRRAFQPFYRLGKEINKNMIIDKMISEDNYRNHFQSSNQIHEDIFDKGINKWMALPNKTINARWVSSHAAWDFGTNDDQVESRVAQSVSCHALQG